MSKKVIYAPGGAGEQLESLFDSINASVRESGAKVGTRQASEPILEVFDSAQDKPEAITKLVELMGGDSQHTSAVLDSVAMGMAAYEREHGIMPTADIIEAALQQGKSAAEFDGVGSTSHSDNQSAMPNRVITAITMGIAEAIPFAAYLPADIGSNESRLAIVSHLAGSDFGAYSNGQLMDGISLGDAYMSSERRLLLTASGDRTAYTGQIVAKIGGNTGVPLLRGRCIVFVNGLPVAYESSNANAAAANSPISGVAKIGSTEYTIGGTVTVATGSFNLTASPALPANTVVEVEGSIDLESRTDLAPEFVTQVQTYTLLSSAWRGLARQSIDSRTQYNNEINVDLLSESTMGIRNQFAMERHYAALGKAKSIAIALNKDFNFDYSLQMAQKTRAQIWQDFLTPLGEADQLMAENTMDHGITHLYVTKTVAAQLASLPREMFEPSGITARPSIYRVGRLFGRFEVYYTPKGLVESPNGATAQILALGRSQQVARCPIVMGDAVPATLLPLGRNADLKDGVGFYGRNFTQVNPHLPSAMGVALLTVNNMR